MAMVYVVMSEEEEDVRVDEAGTDTPQDHEATAGTRLDDLLAQEVLTYISMIVS